MSFRTISALEGLIIHPSPDLDNEPRKNADADAPMRSGCDAQGAAAHSGAERKEVQSCSRRRSDGDILISRGAAVRGAGVGRKLRGSLGAALAMIGEEDGEISDRWCGAARGRGDVSLQPRKGKRKMNQVTDGWALLGKRHFNRVGKVSERTVTQDETDHSGGADTRTDPSGLRMSGDAGAENGQAAYLNAASGGADTDASEAADFARLPSRDEPPKRVREG